MRKTRIKIFTGNLGDEESGDKEFTLDDMLAAITYGFTYHRDSMNDNIDVPEGNKLQWLLSKYVKPEDYKDWLDKHNIKKNGQE